MSFERLTMPLEKEEAKLILCDALKLSPDTINLYSITYVAKIAALHIASLQQDLDRILSTPHIS